MEILGNSEEVVGTNSTIFVGTNSEQVVDISTVDENSEVFGC